MPSAHPWNTGRPSLVKLYLERVTPVGFTGPTSSQLQLTWDLPTFVSPPHPLPDN